MRERAKRVRAKTLSFRTAKALVDPHANVFDGANVPPEEATEKKIEDMHLWNGLHHRLGHGARTQHEALPEPRTGRRKGPTRR